MLCKHRNYQTINVGAVITGPADKFTLETRRVIEFQAPDWNWDGDSDSDSGSSIPPISNKGIPSISNSDIPLHDSSYSFGVSINPIPGAASISPSFAASKAIGRASASTTTPNANSDSSCKLQTLYDLSPLELYIPLHSIKPIELSDIKRYIKDHFLDSSGGFDFSEIGEEIAGEFSGILRELGALFGHSGSAMELPPKSDSLKSLKNAIREENSLSSEEKEAAIGYIEELGEIAAREAKKQEDMANQQREFDAETKAERARTGEKILRLLITGTSPAKIAASYIKEIYSSYLTFAAEYPLVAQYGLSGINIALQTIMAGPAGMVNALRGEAQGAAIGAVAGDQIDAAVTAAVEFTASGYMKLDFNLLPEEAMLLASATIIGTVLVANGASYTKQFISKIYDAVSTKVITRKLTGDVLDLGVTKKHSKVLDHYGQDTGYKHWTDVESSILQKEINISNHQIQAKFKHAERFGIIGNYNKQNVELYKQKIMEHIKDPETVAIAGTYRGTQKVVHYFNPKTEINVMKDTQGNYISGWKLKGQQLYHIKYTGNIN